MNTDREELARQQEQLLNALLCGEPAPVEVDPHQVQACSVSLKQKRARVLNKLSGAGDTTCSIMDKSDMNEYFRAYPGIHPDGGWADLKRYKRFVKNKWRRALVASIIGLTSFIRPSTSN